MSTSRERALPSFIRGYGCSKSSQERVACVADRHIAEDLALTPAQEFREARNWLKQHKRDPFLLLIIVMTLLMFTLNFGSIVILSSAFPPVDAKRAIGQVSPYVDLRIAGTKTSCKLPRGTYLFGYDLQARTDQEGGRKVGRICRDILNGGWVWAFDELESE
jgi:hypothetical protein